MEYIYNTTLRDIISQTTSINSNELQENVFFHRQGDPCPQPFQINSTGLEKCVPFMRFDHFTGNEVSFIFTCIILGTVPIGKISKIIYLKDQLQNFSLHWNWLFLGSKKKENGIII